MIDLDRFGLEAGEASLRQFVFETFHGIGCQRNDGELAAAGSQAAGCGLSVHDRHLHVHQDQVERLRGDTVDGDLAVLGLAHAQADFFQQHAHELAVLGSVVHHQHMARREPPLHGCRCSRSLRRNGQEAWVQKGRARQVARVQPYAESRALAIHTAGRDVTPHGARKTTADRQAQAGAPEMPRGGCLGLYKRLEHRLQLVRRNANPAVLHIDAVTRLLAPLFQPHDHLDAAAVRELDRIADQVGQDLAQPRRIAFYGCGQRLREHQLQREALFRRTFEQGLHHFTRHQMGRKRNPLSLQAPGLDLGQIQNVVDKVQQVPAAGMDDFQMFGRIRRLAQAAAAAQHLGETQNRVHGGADLVAHIGQELALGFVGGVGLFLGSLQCCTTLFKFGHILEADDKGLYAAVIVQNGRTVGAQRIACSTGAGNGKVHVALRILGRQRKLPRQRVARKRALVAVAPTELRRRASHQALLWHVQHQAGGFVGKHNSALAVQHHQTLGQGVIGCTHALRHGARRVQLTQHAFEVEEKQHARHGEDEGRQLQSGILQLATPPGRTQRGEAQFHVSPLLARLPYRHHDFRIGGFGVWSG